MKIHQVDQNTPAWKVFRGKGLGASDAPVIMGDSPWSTPFELWSQKIGLLERAPANFYQQRAMDRGTQLEPMVREKFEVQIGLKFPPIVAEHDHFEFVRASLDGFNEVVNKNLEIKCPSKVDHAKALKGVVPSKYVAQLAHQIIVTGAVSTYYVSYYSEDLPLAVVEVTPDAVYNALLLDKLKAFWKNVETKTPPLFAQSDLISVFKTLSKNFETLSTTHSLAKLMFETMEARGQD
jgi:putative phage-type endonuclease